MPYWTTNASTASFVANSDLFSEISPFWFDTGASGSAVKIKEHLTAAQRAPVLAQLRGKGVKVVPSVTDGTPAGFMASVLKSPARRAAHVAQLLEVVASNGFDGIDLDYEHFAFNDGQSSWAATRPAWVSFVQELSAGLHATGKLLTVAVPPPDYTVYDYKSIGPFVDRIRIMTYDYSWSSPGPIAPLPWVKKVAATAASLVTPSKIQIGIPTYGKDWSRGVTGTCPAGVAADVSTKVYNAATMATTLQTLGIPAASITRHAEYRESTFKYSKTYKGQTAAGSPTSCTVNREVWFADAQSALDRVQIIDDYKLGGAAFWTVGGEDAATWSPVRDYARGLSGAPAPTPAPTVSPTAGSATIAQAISAAAPKRVRPKAKVKIAGSVTPARAGAVIQRHRLIKGRWVALGDTTTDAGGRYLFVVRPTGKNQIYKYRIVAPAAGPYRAGMSKIFVIRTSKR